MRYNKTLGVAVAAILSGGIGLASSAGELEFNRSTVIPLGTILTEPTFLDAAIPVASESVDDDGTTTSAAVVEVTTVFEFERKANIIFNIYVDFTLTGAEFGVNLDAPILSNVDNANTAAITRISGGQATDTTVRYMLQGGKNNIRTNNKLGNAYDPAIKEDILVFKFTPFKTVGLASNGGTVKLKAEWGGADVDFVVSDTSVQTIYQATAGVTVKTVAEEPPAKIDVTEGSKKFVDGISQTAITLGTIRITDTNSVISDNVDGTLVITGGPFLASTGENQVFLDFDLGGGVCVFNPDALIPDLAGIVNGDEVTFDLDTTSVDAMELADINVCVLVAEDNEVEINDTKDRATSALTLSYPSKKDIAYVGRLAQTKRNGTACTLYNVPHKQASDRGFYRFINKTDKDSTVWGTIRDREGVEYLVDQELGLVAANSTLVVNSDQLHDYAITSGAAVENPWTGRAILTINSNSTNMEAYALLRGKNTKNVLLPAGVATAPANIGPLINVSAGASGNGCD